MNMHLSQDRDFAERQLPSLSGASVVRIDGPLTCASRKVRQLHESWQRLADGSPPPDWSRFDVVEHKSIVANLYVIRRAAPGDWSFALKGESAHEIYPREKATGRVIDVHDATTASELIDYYETIAATGCCHFVRGTIVNDRKELVDIESIDCPFVDHRRGQHLILGVIERVATRAATPA